MTSKLNDKLVKKLPAPSSGNKITYDNDIRGFGVRITAKNAVSFILNYRIHGRERRYTIGSYPDWSVTAARAEAKDLKRQVDRGEDPLEVREEARAAATINDLWKRYEKEHLPTKAERAQADDRSMFNKYILPELGTSTRLHDVQFSDVDQLHKKISKQYPVRANRVLEVLRKAFNLAEQWKLADANPCKGVKRNKEHRRVRYLSDDERVRLLSALDAHTETVSANAIKLLLLTGARKGEVLNAAWEQFNLPNSEWVKPASHTKQKREHRAILSSAAVDILQAIYDDQRKDENTESVFVFPGKSNQQPLTDIKRSWLSICIKAKLAVQVEKCNRQGKVMKDKDGNVKMTWQPTARIHDLRHSFASVLVSNGASLPVVGAMLGHSQPNTTARYAHLMDQPLREAAESAAKSILNTNNDVSENEDDHDG